jgi:AraC-like DNA-binding protein
MGPSLASLIFPIEFGGVLQTAREIGIDVAPLCEFHGDDGLSERSRNWDRIMRAVRLDGFPIRVAQRISFGEIGLIGMAARVAPDLRTALEHSIDIRRVFPGALNAFWVREDVARGTTVVELRLGNLGLGWRCRREMMIASVLRFAREISGTRIRPRCVYFRHAEPSDPSEHQAYFDCEVRFDADLDAIEFDRDTLAIPLPGADGNLSRFLLDHRGAIAGAPPSASATLETKVRQAIRSRLGEQTLAMEPVARELGLSARTLARRLARHESSYHEILDDVRRELADALIDDPDRSLSEVASLLGFSDASAFHRAYVRWNGRTPSSLRRASLRPRAADCRPTPQLRTPRCRA